MKKAINGSVESFEVETTRSEEQKLEYEKETDRICAEIQSDYDEATRRYREENFSNFANGRSWFELMLYNWGFEDRSYISTYMFLSLSLPVGLIWWKTDNWQSGAVMCAILSVICWLFVLLGSGFSQTFLDGLNKSDFVWYKVRLKSGSSISLGLLNFVHWFIVQASFLLILGVALIFPLYWESAKTDIVKYLVCACTTIQISLLFMFGLSYIWKLFYYILARIIVGINRSDYRLVYIWNPRKVYKKSF